jgi:hypothetical protein
VGKSVEKKKKKVEKERKKERKKDKKTETMLLHRLHTPGLTDTPFRLGYMYLRARTAASSLGMVILDGYYPELQANAVRVSVGTLYDG